MTSLTSRTVLALTGLIAVVTLAGFSQRPLARQGDAAHGRYLVERVGMCIDCHSPRDEKGEFVAERWLQGAVLPFTPAVPMPWAPVAKPIAGLPTLTDEQALTFLTTGVLPGGRRPLPPMPPYAFSAEDARDVIAYLRAPIAPAPGTH